MITDNDNIDAATYILKVTIPHSIEASPTPIYSLEMIGESSSEPEGFFSPEELVNRINHTHAPNMGKNSSDDKTRLRNQVQALQQLISCEKHQLERLRYKMTDRITSAMNRLSMLKSYHENQFSENEYTWLDQGVTNLTQISETLEDCARLCDVININQLEDIDHVAQMVSDVSTFELMS